MGVLPGFSGIAHRDAYRPYDDYKEKRDSLCCGHIMRELEFAIECDGQVLWVQPMKDLLLEINQQVAGCKDEVADKRWQERYRKNTGRS